MKKIFSFLMVILLSLTCSIIAFAESNDCSEDVPSNLSIVAYSFEGDIDQYLENVIYNNISSELGCTRMSEWRIEYGESVDKIFSAYAGNQPRNGTNFGSTGGAFIYVDNGGPSVSASVSLGPPYGSVSVSVAMGKCGVNGYSVNVPANYGYCKLFVTKTITIKPYTLYTKESGSNTWESRYGYEKALKTIDFSINRV